MKQHRQEAATELELWCFECDTKSPVKVVRSHRNYLVHFGTCRNCGKALAERRDKQR